jgi:hypothetical protein
MITSGDNERAFYKIYFLHMRNTLSKLVMEGNFLNLIKKKKTPANIPPIIPINIE